MKAIPYTWMLAALALGVSMASRAAEMPADQAKETPASACATGELIDVPVESIEPAKDFAGIASNYLLAAAVTLRKPKEDHKACIAELGRVLLKFNANPAIWERGSLALLAALNDVADAMDNEKNTEAAANRIPYDTTLATAGDETAPSVLDMLQLTREKAANAVGGQAHYDIYAGPMFSLTPDGGWKSGFDLMYRSESAFFWKEMGKSYVQFAYFTHGGEKLKQNDGDTDTTSPFDAKGGIANIQAGMSLLCGKWWGFGGRAGYESLPTDKDDSVISTLKPFGAFGLVTRQAYLDDAIGQFFVGYARDQRWNKKYTGEDGSEYNRVLLTGLLELPKIGDNTRLATRIYASMPASGHGGAELRVSLLIGYDLAAFRKLAGY